MVLVLVLVLACPVLVNITANGRSAVEMQSNGSRTAVESKSSLSCNRRIKTVQLIGGNATVSDAWPVRSQTYDYLPGLRGTRLARPRKDGQAELTRCRIGRPSKH